MIKSIHYTEIGANSATQAEMIKFDLETKKTYDVYTSNFEEDPEWYLDLRETMYGFVVDEMEVLD